MLVNTHDFFFFLPKQVFSMGVENSVGPHRMASSEASWP